MTVTKQRAGDRLVIAAAGRLGATIAPDFQTGLIPEVDAPQNIVLAFGSLEYISSPGLRVLLWAEKTVRAKGGTMTLMHVSAAVQGAFEMTGLTGVLTIE